MKTINKLIYTQKDFNELIENLKINEENFNIFYSSSKLIIENDGIKYTFYPNKLGSKKGLHFIKKLKKYIIDNKITYDFKNRIKYNSQNSLIKNSINYSKDLYEVDLKAAYWHLAYRNKFINYDLFKEGLRVDKRIRLMALGSLAKNTTVFNYKDGELIGTQKITSELTEGIFFKVAFDTDIIMRELIRTINKNDFMFYWVDAIFFRGKNNLKLIEKKLKSIDIFYKVVNIKKLIKKQNKFEVEDFDFKKREFNFIKKNTQKFI